MIPFNHFEAQDQVNTLIAQALELTAAAENIANTNPELAPQAANIAAQAQALANNAILLLGHGIELGTPENLNHFANHSWILPSSNLMNDYQHEVVTPPDETPSASYQRVRRLRPSTEAQTAAVYARTLKTKKPGAV